MGSTIKISESTKVRLKSLAIVEGESYEQIILRLLDVKLNGQCIDYSISYNNISVKCVIDWSAKKENILFYNNDGLSRNIVYDGDDENYKCFVDKVNGCVNLINILAILEDGERIVVDGLVLERL